jgi:hypothetical protein
VELCPRLEEMTLLYESSGRKLEKNKKVVDEEQELENQDVDKDKDHLESENEDIETVEPNLLNTQQAEEEEPLDLQQILAQMAEEIGPFPPQFEGLKANGCPSLKRF